MLRAPRSNINFKHQTSNFLFLNCLTFARNSRGMKLSHLAETLIGSEIVKLGGEIRERIRQGERIYNFTVGDFDPSIFPIPKELEEAIIEAYRNRFTNYPPGEGSLELREAVAAFALKYQGLSFT